MANDYYDALCLEMDECLRNQEYKQIISRMNEELSMPYIPLAFEERFIRYRKEASAMLASSISIKKEIMEVETFETLLFDESLEVQLLAVEGLRQVNITPYQPLIQQYLEQPLFEEVQSLLIYELIERGLRDEFTTTKDGFSVIFTPYYLELPQDSDSFIGCATLLEEWIAKNPSLLQLCMQILQILFMKRLPLAYDDDEVQILSASVVYYACSAMEDYDTWNEVKMKCELNEADLINIELD